MFTRSPSGMNADPSFRNVDIILYCEGSAYGDFTIDDILDSNKYYSNTNDIIFWETIFDTFYPQKKVKVKSIGSSNNIKKMKEKIITNNIQNHYVARDRDYKHMNIFENKVDNIELVTYGYSWENDIFSLDTALKLYKLLSRSQIHDEDIIELKILFAIFEKKLSKIITLDINLSTYYNESAFQKSKNPIRLIDNTGIPKPKMSQFRNDLKEIRKRLEGKINFQYPIQIDFNSDCQGHLLAEVYYRIIIYLVNNKLNGKQTISKDMFMTFAISSSNINNSYISAHYEEMMKKII